MDSQEQKIENQRKRKALENHTGSVFWELTNATSLSTCSVFDFLCLPYPHAPSSLIKWCCKPGKSEFLAPMVERQVNTTAGTTICPNDSMWKVLMVLSPAYNSTAKLYLRNWMYIAIILPGMDLSTLLSLACSCLTGSCLTPRDIFLVQFPHDLTCRYLGHSISTKALLIIAQCS